MWRSLAIFIFISTHVFALPYHNRPEYEVVDVIVIDPNSPDPTNQQGRCYGNNCGYHLHHQHQPTGSDMIIVLVPDDGKNYPYPTHSHQYPTRPNQQVYPTRPNQQVYPTRPNQQVYPTWPNQEVYPTRPNQQVYPTHPNQQVYPTRPNQQIYPTRPNQQVYPTRPNQQIYPTRPNQQIYPTSVPDYTINPVNPYITNPPTRRPSTGNQPIRSPTIDYDVNPTNPFLTNPTRKPPFTPVTNQPTNPTRVIPIQTTTESLDDVLKNIFDTSDNASSVFDLDVRNS